MWVRQSKDPKDLPTGSLFSKLTGNEHLMEFLSLFFWVDGDALVIFTYSDWITSYLVTNSMRKKKTLQDLFLQTTDICKQIFDKFTF